LKILFAKISVSWITISKGVYNCATPSKWPGLNFPPFDVLIHQNQMVEILLFLHRYLQQMGSYNVGVEAAIFLRPHQVFLGILKVFWIVKLSRFKNTNDCNIVFVQGRCIKTGDHRAMLPS
jgi:hypothetical protein